MRPEPNKEMDLLLRQLSRRNGIPISEIDEQHLDADELNSYVANALPPAARARYTAHLADCSSCRKLVAQLSAAQGPVAVQQSAGVVAPSGLMSFLASLFSPMVLRYAVPALGLIVVAVVGLFVWRQQPSGRNSVAQLHDTSANAPVPATQPAPEVSASRQDALDRASSSSTSGEPSANKTLPAKTDTSQQGPAAPAPMTKEAPVAGNQPADAAGTGAQPTAAAPKVAQTEAEPARPAKALLDTDLSKQKKAEPAEQEAASREEVKKREEQSDKNQYQKSETVDVTRNSTARRDMQVQTARRGAPAPGAGTADAAPDLKRTRSAQKDEDASAETRSVAGRRFRKTSGGWVDTAYDSSKPVTTVARGSEHYRGLVADEPSIRTIAEQLDGEVIVVWKGRTYRLR